MRQIKASAIYASMLSTLLICGCNSDDSSDDSVTYDSGVIYVDVDATGNNDGTSWADAFTDLQDALAASVDGYEIWVAEGTYYPTDDSDRDISFTMVDGVSLYGGFTGTETSLDERDWENNVTTMSGDIGTKDDNSDNTYQIVVAANNLIDGFTITAGNGSTTSDSSNLEEGGEGGEGEELEEVEEDTGSEIGHLNDEIITSGDVDSESSGNGIIIYEKAPTIKNTIITKNEGGKAAGVYIYSLPDSGDYPTFVNVTISYNVGSGRGGGVAMDYNTQAYFIDCIFDSNESTDGKGGAIYNDIVATPLIENSLFVNNSTESGGAIANDGNSNTVVSNSTYYNNYADEESAVSYQGTGAYNDPKIIDSIVWNNYCDQGQVNVFNWSESKPTISYTIMEGGYIGDGENVIDVDPLFTDPDNLDFSYSEDSPANTAGSDGGSIGFDATLLGTRSDDEIAEIIEYLDSLNVIEEVTPLDLTNPIDADDAADIGEIVYVDPNASGEDDGSTWEDAFTSLQEAINYAGAAYELNGTSVDVWVVAGTYYTGTERTDAFIMQQGVNLYGGFAGDETSFDERDYTTNETILSGEIGDTSDLTDNSYHVVVGADDVILDGLTISDGYADGLDGSTYDNKGGGLLNYEAGNRNIPIIDYTLGFDITISNCTFSNNYAETGGASYTFHGGNPTYSNVTFSGNSAKYGGAVADVAGTNAIYENVTFEGNSALYKGGASFTDYGSMATFYDSSFSNNSSGTAGGAIYVLDRASQEIENETDFDLIDDTWDNLYDIYSSVYVDGCSFTDNIAGSNGGAMYVYESSYGKILNSSFESNSAVDAAIVAANYGEVILDSATTFSDNTPTDLYAEDTASITYE